MQIILKATITINFQIWKDSPGCVDETGRLNLAYLAMDPCEWQDEVRPRKRSTKRLDKTLRKESERNRSSDHVESDEASAPDGTRTESCRKRRNKPRNRSSDEASASDGTASNSATHAALAAPTNSAAAALMGGGAGAAVPLAAPSATA